MNRKEAFNYLTDTVAVSYRPRRMPWEHDQDSPDVQRSVLIRWVDEIARHPQHVVEQAFSALMRHAPNQVPTLNEAAGQLRRLAESQRSQDRFAGDVLPPETGLCVAYEAYCLEVARLGRVPDESRFTKKFNAMFPS